MNSTLARWEYLCPMPTNPGHGTLLVLACLVVITLLGVHPAGQRRGAEPLHGHMNSRRPYQVFVKPGEDGVRGRLPQLGTALMPFRSLHDAVLHRPDKIVLLRGTYKLEPGKEVVISTNYKVVISAESHGQVHLDCSHSLQPCISGNPGSEVILRGLNFFPPLFSESPQVVGMLYFRGGRVVLDQCSIHGGEKETAGMLLSIEHGSLTVANSRISNVDTEYPIRGFSSDIQVVESEFNHVKSKRATLHVQNSKKLHLKGVTFRDIKEGGSIAAVDVGRVVIDRVLVQDCSSVFPQIDIPSSKMEPSKPTHRPHVVINSAFERLVAPSVIGVTGSRMLLLNATFVENRGGRSVLVGDGADAMVRGCQFERCNDGALIAVRANATIVDTRFEDNRGAVGAGVFAEDCLLLKVQSSSFLQNHGRIGAGIAVLGSRGGVLHVADSSFHDNNGSDGGTGMFLESVDATIVNTTFIGGVAKANGGGIYFRGKGMDISASVFAEHNATSGAAIFVAKATGHIRIDDCAFFSNSASGTGGAIVFEKGTCVNTSISLSVFKHNTAFNGGAIAAYDCPFNVNDCIIDENEAMELGGGLFIAGNSSNGVYNVSRFQLNQARGGGAAYVQGSAPYFSHCIFKGNNASTSLGRDVLSMAGGQPAFRYNNRYDFHVPALTDLETHGYYGAYNYSLCAWDTLASGTCKLLENDLMSRGRMEPIVFSVAKEQEA